MINTKISENPDYLYNCTMINANSINAGDSTEVKMFLLGFTVFSFISMFFCIIVAMTILYNKKLRELHPSLILGLMAICEYINSYCLFIYRIGTVRFSCYWAIPYVFSTMLNFPKALPNHIYKNVYNTTENYYSEWNEIETVKVLENSIIT